MVGDYEEEYREIVLKKSVFIAKTWWCLQIFILVPGFFKNSICWNFIMFKNYLKTSLRNIKKDKGYSLINIMGLAVGLTCVILIMLYIQYEFSYDRYHENAKNIYRIVMFQKGNKYLVSDAGVAVLMAEAALRSAALNVLINLGTLKDEEFVADRRAKLESLLEGRGVMRDEIYDYVVSRL